MFKYYCIVYILITSHVIAQGKTILVYGGKTGYLGQKMVEVATHAGHTIVCAQARLENYQGVEQEIKTLKPDYIINAAGIGGRPTIDWCDNHQPETIRVNIIGTLNLIDCAFRYGIHITTITTGCVYSYDQAHPVGQGLGFKETETPNFDKVFYTRSKIELEKLMQSYPNVLIARITMPIACDTHPKNFIIKLLNYKKLMDVPISFSVLDDLWPIVLDMTLKKRAGIYNVVNPGVISPAEIMQLYKAYCDPSVTYETFSVIEHLKILYGYRSTCALDPSKIMAEYPEILPIKESIVQVLKKLPKQIFNEFHRKKVYEEYEYDI